MNAIEAKQTADGVIEEKELTLDKMLAFIGKAAKAGSMDLLVEFIIPEDIVKELKSLGYNVFNDLNRITIVDWRNPYTK